jgi:hypothetical protein
VIFNDWLDAGVTALLAMMVLILLLEALLEWSRILGGRKRAVLHEAR